MKNSVEYLNFFILITHGAQPISKRDAPPPLLKQDVNAISVRENSKPNIYFKTNDIFKIISHDSNGDRRERRASFSKGDSKRKASFRK